MTANSFLVLTVAHHGDQEFYEIGRVPLEVPAEVFLQRLPVKDHDCGHEDMCLILDYWESEAAGISDDCEIDVELANVLFDGQFDRLLQEAQEDLASFYAEMR